MKTSSAIQNEVRALLATASQQDLLRIMAEVSRKRPDIADALRRTFARN